MNIARQLPLILTDAAHSNDSTSRAAAKSIVPHKSRLQARVLAVLAACGQRGATREELAQMTELSGDTIRPRVDELRRYGWIVETVRERPTRSGRMARVLVTKEVADGS